MDMMTIKQVAARINRSEQTILNWEKEGLITPERDDRGWRLFSEDDIKQMEQIKKEKLQIKLSGKGEN